MIFQNLDSKMKYLSDLESCFKIVLTLCFILLLSSCKKDTVYFEDKGAVFSTSYTIKYSYHQSLQNEIEERLSIFDDSLNPFKSTSIISKINNNEEVVVDSLFKNVFNRSQEISKISEGLFDITISPLINAWGFGFKNMSMVDQHVIDSLRFFMGYDKVCLVNDKIEKKDKRLNLNMSAIAKGYSCDVVAYLLESYGIENYMIEIGGEIRTKGLNAKGHCWHIAVTKPLKTSELNYHQEHIVLQLCNKSLATSGSFHKYYIKEGKKYAHTIDPRTGYPAENSILSATVIADDCMTADAFATVFMLTDTAKTREIAMKEGLSYILILDNDKSDFEIVQSADFADFMLK